MLFFFVFRSFEFCCVSDYILLVYKWYWYRKQSLTSTFFFDFFDLTATTWNIKSMNEYGWYVHLPKTTYFVVDTCVSLDNNQSKWKWKMLLVLYTYSRVPHLSIVWSIFIMVMDLFCVVVTVGFERLRNDRGDIIFVSEWVSEWVGERQVRTVL